MANEKAPGIDIDALQEVLDGTLCRASSPVPGPAGFRMPINSPLFVADFVYCGVWDEEQRKAFLTGFIGRLEEYKGDIENLIEWILEDAGLGDAEGDFAEAWSNFGSSLQELAFLAWKITIVIGVPFYMIWHPKRDQYREELKDLGISITDAIIQDYKDAYEQGGIPQCVGRLYADIIVLVVEALAAKGAGKVLKSLKVERFIPEKMKKALGEKLPLSERRRQFIRSMRVAAHTDAGMPAHHFNVFQVVARDPTSPRIILVRATNPKCASWIAKKYPPKPQILGEAAGKPLKTSPTTGFVTCKPGQVDAARKIMKPNTQKKYYVVDTDGKFAIDGDGSKLDLSDVEWKKQIEPGQVIDPVDKKPVVGDYDLQGVIDPNATGRIVSSAVDDGVVVSDFSNPDVKKVAAKINDKLDQKRILHGPDEFFRSLKKLKDNEVIIAFFPDGKPRVFSKAQAKKMYKLWKRPTADLGKLKKQALGK